MHLSAYSNIRANAEAAAFLSPPINTCKHRTTPHRTAPHHTPGLFQPVVSYSLVGLPQTYAACPDMTVLTTTHHTHTRTHLSATHLAVYHTQVACPAYDRTDDNIIGTHDYLLVAGMQLRFVGGLHNLLKCWHNAHKLITVVGM